MPNRSQEIMKELRREKPPNKRVRCNVISTHHMSQLNDGEVFFRFISPTEFNNIKVYIYIGNVPDDFEGDIDILIVKSDGSRIIFNKNLDVRKAVNVFEISDVQETDRVMITANISKPLEGVWVTISGNA